MSPRITVVGSVNMDLVFRTPRMPLVGETIKGQAFHQIAGGKGANQAVAAARMGGAVNFVGAVGDDGFGQSSRAGLQAEGIVLQHLRVVAGVATGTAGILVDDAGRNSIVIAGGANDDLSVVDVQAAVDTIRNSASLICQLETPMPTVECAIALAHAAGVPVIFNPAPVQALPDALLAQVDTLVVNETEAGQLSGIEVKDAASARQACESLRSRGPKVVVLTLGEQGVCVADGQGMDTFPAVRVQPVDTTAAGDTFVGALAVLLGEGCDVRTACARAQYAAALTVTRLGAQTSIPRRDEVEEFMRERRSAQVDGGNQ